MLVREGTTYTPIRDIYEIISYTIIISGQFSALFVRLAVQITSNIILMNSPLTLINPRC